MANRTWAIEIITDHHDPKKDELMKELLLAGAKHMLTQAMLLQDRRAPQCKLETGDHFSSTEEILLADDMTLAEPAAPSAATEGAHSPNAKRANQAGYTVNDKGDGWRFNDPDGKWSEKSFPTEAAAWEAAHAELPE